MKTGESGKIEESLINDVQNEVSIVNSLKHAHINKILGVGEGEYNPQNGEKPYHVLFIIMEYAENGELFSLISSTGKFSEDVARYFFIQLLDALNYMHNEAKICHRDIKPENILIDKDFNLKVADYGFATNLRGEDGSYVLHDYMGTLGYMPPEQHILNSYTGKGADMFATAVVLFTMVTQCQPFEKAVGEDKYYRLIGANRSDIYWKIFNKTADLSVELKDLLTGMFQYEPSKRYTME